MNSLRVQRLPARAEDWSGNEKRKNEKEKTRPLANRGIGLQENRA
jgi:hypothetical protein